MSKDFSEFDWPSNDVPPCTDFDAMRNGIHAYYCLLRTHVRSAAAEGRLHEAALDRLNPGYSDALLGAEAKRNVAILKDIAEKGTGCLIIEPVPHLS